MPLLMLKEIPRYECLQEAAEQVPGMDAASCEVFLSLLGTGDLISRAEAGFLSQHGLSQGRLIVLMLLDCATDGSLRSSELADQAAVSRATMTGLLDSLEREGWIARAIDPRDRRAFSVKITVGGEALLGRVMPSYLRWISETMAPLSPDERALLIGLLKKIHQSS